MRALSSAWIVSGTSISARSTVAVHSSPSCWSTPSSTSIRSSSPMKSGLPSLAVVTRSKTSSGSQSVSSTSQARRRLSSMERPSRCSTALRCPPSSTSEGRSSRSSGRAVSTSITGASRVHSARLSIRSSRSGSAQCTSSKISTIGRRRAVFSTSRRTAQKVSSGCPGSPTPRTAAATSATRSRSGVSSSKRAVKAATIVSSLASSSSEAAIRSASAMGAKVGPPAGSHRSSTIRAGRRHRGQLAGQTRLADTGGTDDRRQAGATRLDRVVEHHDEAVQLGGPPDERRAGPGFAHRIELDQPERLDRLRLPTHVERGEGAELGGESHQSVRALADEDLPRLGGRLEPGRHVDRVADDVVVGVRDDDLAGVEADAEASFRIHLGEGSLHPERGFESPASIVLADLGDPEHRHDAVAEQLHEAAAVRIDLLSEGGVEPVDPGADRLDVHLLLAARRPGEVGEEDRDELAGVLAGGRRGFACERRAALVAEPGRPRGDGAAGGTGAHQGCAARGAEQCPLPICDPTGSAAVHRGSFSAKRTVGAGWISSRRGRGTAWRRDRARRRGARRRSCGGAGATWIAPTRPAGPPPGPTWSGGTWCPPRPARGG